MADANVEEQALPAPAARAEQARDRERWSNYLSNRLGFPDDLTDALIEQGYSSFESFEGMKDDDVDRLCATMRKPGGMIDNPVGDLQPDAPLFVGNPGVNVGDRFVRRLKQLAYFLRYIKKVQRPTFVTHMGPDQLQRLWVYKEQEEKRESNPDYPEKYTTSKNARETLENMMEWIEASYGVDDIPLSYIIRDS